MRAKHVVFVASFAVAGLACGGGGPAKGKGEPRLIPGGGIGDGPLHGTLNVFVIDEDTRNVVSSAAVRVGPSDELEPCEALTDSTGLARFTETGGDADGGTGGAGCKLLTKPATITVSATGHAPSTWIGVDGGNVTVALRAISPNIPRATVTGTIAGWDAMPDPAADHNRLAIIGASSNPALTDRANNMDQGTRSVDVDVVGVGVVSFDVAANVCVRNSNPLALVNDCNWVLTTHTGPQAHFAILVDQDTKGTPDDDTDDTFTATGWAIKTGLTFGEGTTTNAESLQPIADADMQSFAATFASGPSGLDNVVGLPQLDLGTDGRIAIILPALNKTMTTTRVPKLTGPLEGAHYDMIASATDDPAKPLPATITWLRNVNPSATVAVTGWMAPPTAIAMSGGQFSFTPVAGATVHGADLQTMDGQRRWGITIFDGTTEFTLPGLAPDPLPLGTIQFAVSALRIPGVDLKNIVFDDLTDLVTDISTDAITYSR